MIEDNSADKKFKMFADLSTSSDEKKDLSALAETIGMPNSPAPHLTLNDDAEAAALAKKKADELAEEKKKEEAQKVAEEEKKKMEAEAIAAKKIEEEAAAQRLKE